MLVRINLNPERKRVVKRDPLQSLSIVLGLLLLVEIIACFVLAVQINAKLEELESSVHRKNAEKAQIEAKLSEVPKLQEKIKELQARELTLARLTSMRTGPQHVLDELARILTHPRDAVQMNAAREAAWLLSWDVENVMIQGFEDLGKGNVSIRGQARSMDDISEFWLRLKSSPFFRNIRLGEIKDGKISSLDVNIQHFNFTAEANFNYQTKDGLALLEQLGGEAQGEEAMP
ncbi:MAG: PilN domain-containing protein [Bradymonadales bacterium]|jgi:Tfp pilus assembly protein PilN